MAKYISSIDLAGITCVEHSVIMQELNEQGLLENDEPFMLRLSEEQVERISDIFNDYHIQEINKFFGITKDVKLQFDLFGQLVPAKTKKTKEKSQAPERTWESSDYLPDLEACKNYEYKLFTQEDFAEPMHEEIIFDIEIYNNYFLIMFLGYRTGKCFYFEKKNDEPLDDYWIRWFMENHTLVSFNGIKFDVPLLQCALAGHDTQTLMQITHTLIDDENGLRPYQVVKQYKGVKLECDHIDLIEVAPLKGSLKLYGARLHTPNLQDLPFKVGIDLSDDQISIVRRYCLNDVQTTWFLYRELRPNIELRKTVSKQYGLELRSKSDAQMAEAIIKSECESAFKKKLNFVMQEVPATVKFHKPAYIRFDRPDLQELCNTVSSFNFTMENGVIQSGILDGLVVNVADSTIRMGIGGIHSSEESVSHYSDDDYEIIDIDIAAMYPRYIIKEKLTPSQLKPHFLPIYTSIYERRLKAKANKDKITDAILKVCINGSYGKLGSRYSILFAPELMINVTIGGQLSILMLAEKIEQNNWVITSANTDGLTVKLLRTQRDDFIKVVSDWEAISGYKMEYTYYNSTHNRDVNNYYACKTDGSIKRKGAYGEETLSKNPQNMVCTDAVAEYLKSGTKIEDYIYACKDVKKFITVRNVTGGAVKDMTYLGKTIRFYHSLSTDSYIMYAKSGAKIATSEKCRPMMKLTRDLPVDLDFGWYIDECYRILKDVGVRY